MNANACADVILRGSRHSSNNGQQRGHTIIGGRERFEKFAGRGSHGTRQTKAETMGRPLGFGTSPGPLKGKHRLEMTSDGGQSVLSKRQKQNIIGTGPTNDDLVTVENPEAKSFWATNRRSLHGLHHRQMQQNYSPRRTFAAGRFRRRHDTFVGAT